MCATEEVVVLTLAKQLWPQRCSKDTKKKLSRMTEEEESDDSSDEDNVEVRQPSSPSSKKKHKKVNQPEGTLALARQQDNKDLEDCHKRFCGVAEMVERSHGKIVPEVVKTNLKNSTDRDEASVEERDCLLAFLFLDGASRKLCGAALCNLENDCTLGADKCPEDVEDAQQVLLLCNVKKNAASDWEEKPTETPFAQQKECRRCWLCNKVGHLKADCPEGEDVDSSSEDTWSQSSHVSRTRAGWLGQVCSRLNHAGQSLIKGVC